MQRDEMRRAAQPPTPGGWQAGSSSPSSPQGLETRSRKRARTHSALSTPADSNGTLGAAVDARKEATKGTLSELTGLGSKALKVDDQNAPDTLLLGPKPSKVKVMIRTSSAFLHHLGG
jgi:hypothetical protein